MTDFDVGFIGFGEAAQAFVSGWRGTQRTDGAAGSSLRIGAYDLLFDAPSDRALKRAECLALDVVPAATAAELAGNAAIVIAAVTADQVHNAANSAAPHLRAQTAYLDINSAAPAKKCAAAAVIGEGYVDVAVLAPVHPKLHQTPLLLGGPGVPWCEGFLTEWNMAFECVSANVGEASMIKMLRSIFVKGIESVTFECAVAAHRAGLADQVFPSLANVLRFTDAKEQADYMMARVAVHGLRRAAEMREVVDTLADLGVSSLMSVASARQQQQVGELELGQVAQDAAQIAALVPQREPGHDESGNRERD
jgi:3-hydroxyisobutyrate dehydrogenase-like beta-hydroxyacid dehydrogenase